MKLPQLPPRLVSVVNEFKLFIFKGNVIDLAVAVIIAAAFKTVIDSAVENLISPIIQLATLQTNWIAVLDDFGKFVGALMKFVLNAAIIFFVFVKPMNMVKARYFSGQPAPVSDEIRLLTEIRDLLKSQQEAHAQTRSEEHQAPLIEIPGSAAPPPRPPSITS